MRSISHHSRHVSSRRPSIGKEDTNVAKKPSKQAKDASISFAFLSVQEKNKNILLKPNSIRTTTRMSVDKTPHSRLQGLGDNKVLFFLQFNTTTLTEEKR